LKDEDFSAENEWKNFCIKATRRALEAINTGASAALWWDAYDNFHEHDQRMTYYGLLSNRDHIYTPKKRFYAARQLFRYVRPGAARIQIDGSAPGLTVAAFKDASSLVIVGVKEGAGDTLEISVPDGTTWDLYQTTREVNGLKMATLTPRQGVLSVRLPSESVFTLVGKEAK